MHRPEREKKKLTIITGDEKGTGSFIFCLANDIPCFFFCVYSFARTIVSRPFSDDDRKTTRAQIIRKSRIQKLISHILRRTVPQIVDGRALFFFFENRKKKRPKIRRRMRSIHSFFFTRTRGLTLIQITHCR